MAVPQCSLVLFAPRRTSAPSRPGVGDPVAPSGIALRKRQDLPSSWRTPMSVCTCSVDSGGTAAPDHCGAAAWPMTSEKQRLPRLVFRSSIAWLSDSLSTLRSAGCPRPTQDSLPAAGQALPDGLSPARFLRKDSELLSYISFPFPKLCLAQSDTPTRHFFRANASRKKTGDKLGTELPIQATCMYNAGEVWCWLDVAENSGNQRYPRVSPTWGQSIHVRFESYSGHLCQTMQHLVCR